MQTGDRAKELWWRRFATAGRVVVHHVDLAPNTRCETAALARLDADERARWHRYRHPRPQRQFALCRAALRAILCERLCCSNDDLAFVVTDYGKPAARVRGAPAGIEFNVSHGGRHGLIALADSGRLGVDLEERIPRHDLDGVIAKAFAPRERRELAAAEGNSKLSIFFRLWTCKEALIKALGSGFSLDTTEFEIPRSMYLECGPADRQAHRRTTFRFPHLPEINWSLEDLGTAEFAVAVAHELTTSGNAVQAAGP